MVIKIFSIGAAVLFTLFMSSAADNNPPAKPVKSLARIESQHQLDAYIKRIQAHFRKAVMLAAPPPVAIVPEVSIQQEAPPPSDETVMVSGSRASITNNQENSVDEGDIVKLQGNYLIVLRRGRLSTISIADRNMKPVDQINAYPPGVDAGSDWYDEMLVSDDRVIIIGYSYSRGGTQVNRFHLGKDGHLSFEDAYQFRSEDYYSSRNYASRLIGHRLVMYSARWLGGGDGETLMPGLRRWDGTGTAPDFVRIGSARQVYYSPGLDESRVNTLHSVVDCDLSAAVLDCKSTSFLGARSRVFYVSSQAVYIYSELFDWFTQKGRGNEPSSAMLYRQPLNGGAPSAIHMSGMPVDQFSFQEDRVAKTLNILLTSEGKGDAMWASERPAGAMALARVPLDLLGDGRKNLPLPDYRLLPPLKADAGLQNRFVGDWVIYGSGSGWGTPETSSSEIAAVSVKGTGLFQFVLPHGADRIEALSGDAVIIGSDSKNLYFSTVLLKSTGAELGDRYVRDAASQAETRSHGFFFRPSGKNGDGLLGLPVAKPARPAYRQLFDQSAAVVFLRRSDKSLTPAGELAANPEGASNDHCVASCVDWYGNARPIFVDDRVFALMGYELVEGINKEGSIAETGRVKFAPKFAEAPRGTAETPAQ